MRRIFGLLTATIGNFLFESESRKLRALIEKAAKKFNDDEHDEILRDLEAVYDQLRDLTGGNDLYSSFSCRVRLRNRILRLTIFIIKSNTAISMQFPYFFNRSKFSRKKAYIEMYIESNGTSHGCWKFVY